MVFLVLLCLMLLILIYYLTINKQRKRASQVLIFKKILWTWYSVCECSYLEWLYQTWNIWALLSSHCFSHQRKRRFAIIIYSSREKKFSIFCLLDVIENRSHLSLRHLQNNLLRIVINSSKLVNCLLKQHKVTYCYSSILSWFHHFRLSRH